MRTWPKVSITIITYNQEKYISQAIDSVLTQIYPGELEIIIRDDFSTDGTARLIKEYAHSHANIIPVSLNENTYSLGVEPMSAAMQFATGDYIFLLEGDDYWTDREKVRKIIELMTVNSIDLCFHKMKGIDTNSNNARVIANHGEEATLFDLKDVILGGPEFMSISGLALKRSNFASFPDWFYEGLPFGDYFIQVIASIANGALYLPEAMGVYRIHAEGSWSSSQNRLTIGRLSNDFELLKSAFKNLENELPSKRISDLKTVASKEYLNYATRAANNGHFKLALIFFADSFYNFPMKTPLYKLKTIFKIIVKTFLHVRY